MNCRVIPSEWEEGQHKLVVMDINWRVEKVKSRKRGVETVKWGKLKEKETEWQERLLTSVDWAVDGTVQEMWDKVAGKVRMVCREVLVKGGKVYVNKETWWWEGDIQDAVRRNRLSETGNRGRQKNC